MSKKYRRKYIEQFYANVMKIEVNVYQIYNIRKSFYLHHLLYLLCNCSEATNSATYRLLMATKVLIIMRMAVGFVNYCRRHKENTLNTIKNLLTEPFKYKTNEIS